MKTDGKCAVCCLLRMSKSLIHLRTPIFDQRSVIDMAHFRTCRTWQSRRHGASWLALKSLLSTAVADGTVLGYMSTTQSIRCTVAVSTKGGRGSGTACRSRWQARHGAKCLQRAAEPLAR